MFPAIQTKPPVFQVVKSTWGFASSVQVFMDIDKPSLSFSSPGWTDPGKRSSSPFCSPSLDSFQCIYVFLGAQSWILCPRCAPKREILISSPSPTPVPGAAQEWLSTASPKPSLYHFLSIYPSQIKNKLSYLSLIWDNNLWLCSRDLWASSGMAGTFSQPWHVFNAAHIYTQSWSKAIWSQWEAFSWLQQDLDQAFN